MSYEGVDVHDPPEADESLHICKKYIFNMFQLSLSNRVRLHWNPHRQTNGFQRKVKGLLCMIALLTVAASATA